MSICKFRPANTPFAMIPNATAQDSKLTPGALGFLTFCASLPADWDLRDAHIQSHFGIGKDALRTLYRVLISAGYAQRNHQVRQPDGTFTTVTEVAAEPIFNRCGFSATGSSAGGKLTTINRNIYKETTKETTKKISNNKPSEAGLTPSSHAKRSRLSFANEFGVEWNAHLDRHIDENRAVAIAKKEGLNSETVRVCLAEYAAESIRGFHSDPSNAWVWLCRNKKQVVLSALGEANMPSWA